MSGSGQETRLVPAAPRFHRGPNRWSPLPVVEVEVDPGPLAAWRAADDPAALARLGAWRDRLETVPYEVARELAAAGLEPERAGATFDELAAGGVAAALQWLVCTLLATAGAAPRHAALCHGARGRFILVTELDDEEVSAAALALARRLLLAAIDDTAIDLEAELAEYAEFADDARLGPSTRSILRAAERRGIPCRRVQNSLCQLGEGVWRRRIWTAETDATGAIAEALAQDKQMTRMLLEQVGVPVPRGRLATTVEEACAAAEDLGFPVVVKPRDGNHGRGVSFGIRDAEDMAEAFEIAIRENHRRSGGVIVEQFARGVAHRLLVVGDRMVAAARGQHDVVVGDGRRTIRELVDDANRDPLRGPNFTDILSLMKLDDLAVALLKRQSLAPDDVPAEGRRVTIKVNGDLTTDETDEVCPDVARHVVLAARAVGLDIAGIDLVAEDVSRPLAEQRGMVIEVNAGPGMFMHIAPRQGKPRPVGEAIVELMFKEGDDGRVPVIVVGGNPRAPSAAKGVADAVAGFLRSGGIVAGLASGGTIDIPGQPAYASLGTERDAAIALFAHPDVEAAVLVSDSAAAASEGLGTLHCEVAALAPALPPAGEALDPATSTLLHALAADGFAVVDADAPSADAILARHGSRVVLADRAAAGPSPRALEHRERGGFVVQASGPGVILASGGREHVLSAGDVASLFAGGPPGDATLLALATLWAAGLLPGDRLMPPRPVTSRLRFDAGGADV